MQLAKQHLDIGLFTTDLARQLSFWQERVGLAFDHLLKLGGGVQQHRFHANGSIIKINHSRQALPSTPASGIAGVYLVAQELNEQVELTDPDGNRLVLIPPGFEEIIGLAVEMRVSDLDAAAGFWRDTLQLPSPAAYTFQVGDSLVLLRQGSWPTEAPDTWRALGWRYLTIQVEDCLHEHRLAISRGAVEAAPPRDFGGVAVVSFIRDPDGNVIELSERRSLKVMRAS